MRITCSYCRSSQATQKQSLYSTINFDREIGEQTALPVQTCEYTVDRTEFPAFMLNTVT